MSLFWRLAAASLLAFGLPVAAEAGAPYPRVQVVAVVDGELFEAVSASERTKLQQEIQDHVAKAAPKIAPCMDWVTTEAVDVAPGDRARLVVSLSKKKYGSFFWQVDLAFDGRIGDGELMPVWKADTKLSTARWHPRDPYVWSELRQQILSTLDAQFAVPAQEFTRALDSKLIAYISIAERIERIDIRPKPPRIVIPLNARRLDLVPETKLQLQLKAALCTEGAGECRLSLRTDGDFDASLQCQLGPNSCCPSLSLTPSVADRLTKADRIRVFLSEDHQHCPYGPDHCPAPGEAFKRP
jgi:hypothetical protein